MKRVILAAAALALIVGPAAAQTKTLKLLSSWDRTNYPALEGAVVFQEELKKASGGKLDIEIKGPETVPPFQQLQPVSAGVFDLLHTAGVYHAGSKGLALVVDAIDPGPEKRRSSGVFDYLDQYYQKHNKVTLVGLTVATPQGYNFVLREPLTADGDFKGRKIRGTQSYFGVIKLLGGTPVVIAGPELYSSLEKGVVDGAAWTASGIVTMKLNEVAQYRVRPTFGNSTLPLLANAAAWSKLTAEERKLMSDAAKRTEAIMLKRGDETLAREDAELDKLGMKYSRFTPERADQVRRTWVTTLWEVAEQCCADGAKELHAIALKANLTN